MKGFQIFTQVLIFGEVHGQFEHKTLHVHDPKWEIFTQFQEINSISSSLKMKCGSNRLLYIVNNDQTFICAWSILLIASKWRHSLVFCALPSCKRDRWGSRSLCPQNPHRCFDWAARHIWSWCLENSLPAATQPHHQIYQKYKFTASQNGHICIELVIYIHL